MVVGLFNGIAICDKCKRIYCIKYQINIIVDPILLHWHPYVTWLVTQKQTTPGRPLRKDVTKLVR